MGDPTPESAQARSKRLLALAHRYGVFAWATEWPSGKRWYAGVMTPNDVADVCSHMHRDKRAALKCGAKLVQQYVDREDRAGRLFS